MKIKLSLFLSACCLMGATADDLVVDNYERVSVVATNGDVSGLGCLEVRPKGTVLLLR